MKHNMEITCSSGYSFEQNKTTDKFNRTITFYVSKQQSSRKLPLVVFITGSGGGSVFIKKDGEIDESVRYRTYLDKINGRARLLVVEKPGVDLFEEPKRWGSAEGCSEEFLQEYTLERWTEANNAAIKAALKLPETDTSKLLVVGHSDGGQIATHVACTNPQVTHVASLAGGGPTQLFDAIYGASQSPGDGNDSNNNSTDAVNKILKVWQDIQANPNSVTKFWMGHPYLRWSSFCASSSMEDLLHCKTKAYIVQGTKDTSVPVVSFDVMRAELLAHKREVVAERIEGADHGMKIKTDTIEINELPNVIGRIMEWFLESKI